MQGHLLPSAGRRFLRVLGFALAQALLFGGLVGLLLYFRTPRTVADPAGDHPPTFRQRWMAPLEALERWSFDWRVRELGSALRPVESVALVAVDDETLANAREDAHAAVATRPWPRELLGRMLNLLADEGASPLLVTMPFPDLSPRGAVPGADDAAFRALLDRRPGSTVLAYVVSTQSPPPVTRTLRPFRVFLGAPAASAAQRELLRRVLEERRPAYLLPDGNQTGVWAGVASEDEGRALARRFELKGVPTVREFAAADRAFQVTPVDLTVLLSEVTVPGLDPEKLLQVKSLEAPAAPLLGPSSAFGFTGVSADSDGVVRGAVELVTYVSADGKPHLLPSVELAAAMRALGTRTLSYEDGRLRIGDRASVPMDESGYRYLVWHATEAAALGRGPLQRVVPAWRVLRNLFDQEADSPLHDRTELGGRAAVVAETVESTAPAPLTSLGVGVSLGALRGQALGNLLASEGFALTDPRVDLLAAFALAFLGALLALTFVRFFHSTLGAVIYFGSVVAALAGWLALSRHWLLTGHGMVAAAGPALALVLSFAATTYYAWRTEQQMREFLQASLGRYVNPDVVRQVFRNTALMRPEKRTVTLCLADLRGFAHLFETLSPETLAALLNAFLSEMTQVCRQNGGQVEYMGDALMAFYGAPVRTARHAHLACETALGMRAALETLRGPWKARFGLNVDFDIGLSTGEVLVGDLGSIHKSNYTVMGRAVDLVARLESANRSYGTRVLASEATRALAADTYAFREVDRVMLAGSPQALYELLGAKASRSKVQVAELAEYEQALEAFRSRRFAEALTLFARQAAQDPVSAVHAERCRQFLRAAPPPDWTGMGDLRGRRA